MDEFNVSFLGKVRPTRNSITSASDDARRKGTMAKVMEGPNRYHTLDELELRAAAAEREVKLLEAELKPLKEEFAKIEQRQTMLAHDHRKLQWDSNSDAYSELKAQRILTRQLWIQVSEHRRRLTDAWSELYRINKLKKQPSPAAATTTSKATVDLGFPGAPASISVKAPSTQQSMTRVTFDHLPSQDFTENLDLLACLSESSRKLHCDRAKSFSPGQIRAK
jgi:hypothetical protein